MNGSDSPSKFEIHVKPFSKKVNRKFSVVNIQNTIYFDVLSVATSLFGCLNKSDANSLHDFSLIVLVDRKFRVVNIHKD